MGRGTFVAAVALVMPCVTLVAQGQAPSLQPATRVRLTGPCDLQARLTAGEQRAGCRFEGRFVMLRADTITLAMADSTRSYALNAMSRL